MSRIQRRIDEKPTKTASLGMAGKIKVGEKVKDAKGNERPSSLDYFRPDAAESYQKLFHATYGDKPDRLTIVFPTNDMSEICQNYYELRDGAGHRIAKGDGLTFMVATPQNGGAVIDIAITPQDPDAWMKDISKKAGKDWREVLKLKFLLPELPVLAYWEFSTYGGASTIPAIVGTIDTVMNFAGRVNLIPFDLSIKKVKSEKAGSKSVYPVVSLTCNISPDSAEKVRLLPANIHTMLTEGKINELAPAVEPEYAEAEVMDSRSFNLVERFFKENKIELDETVDSYTKAARSIATMKDKVLQNQCVQYLSDKAQQCGYQWDKVAVKYVKPT